MQHVPGFSEDRTLQIYAAREIDDDILFRERSSLGSTLLLGNINPGDYLSSPLAGVLQGKFPVDQFIEDGIHIIRPPVLTIQVVGMLPNINS
jgi:hypothetical protein